MITLSSVLARFTRPSSGAISPVRSLSKVVLPVPLAPTTPIRSPRVMRSEKSRMMVRSPKRLVTLSASITTLVLASSLARPSLAVPAGPIIAARVARISWSLASRPWLRLRRAVTPRSSQCTRASAWHRAGGVARFLGKTCSVQASKPPKPISARRMAAALEP
jgi:hypothetical protein